MNVEKIKEALKANLEALCSLDKNQFGDVIIDGIPSHPVMVELVGRTREALAELEKPSEENARIIAIDISLGALDRAEYWEVIVPQVIQQYAESYHAKKCAECIGNLPAFPHRPSRFPESHSGVTTDVDK